MTFHLPNQIDYIAFRGTDASFVGWKEDFNLCFQENIPSQISALNYVNNYKTNHKLILGGHSKGAQSCPICRNPYTQSNLLYIQP